MKFLNLSHNHSNSLSLLLALLVIVALFLMASILNNQEVGPGERLIISHQLITVSEIEDGYQLDGLVIVKSINISGDHLGPGSHDCRYWFSRRS